MIASGTSTSPHTGEGVLQQIDLVNRSVTIFFEEGPLTFDVPLSSEVLLNGERVKLRMLEPRDRVRLSYFRSRGLLTVLSLEVSSRSDRESSEP